MESLAPHPKPVRLLFFWIGILATFCYRAIIMVNHYSAVWVTVLWYIGTIGFILYFAHRYQISEKRARVIAQYQLDEKVKMMPNLTDDERSAMHYLLSSLESSKEKWNDIFIFVTSGLALVVGIILDFFV